MKTQVEALKDNQKKLTVTIEAEDVNTRIKKTYKDFAHKYKFPGFRPGKAPRPVIDNALGASAVVATVTEDILNQTYPLALDEQDLFPIDQPQFGEDLMAQADKPFTYDVTLTCAPEFTLSNYEPVEVVLPSEKANEVEVAEQLDQLREYYHEFKDASAASKVKEDSFVEITMGVKDESGAEIESLAAEKRLYEVGKGLFPTGFDTELIGMKKGQTKEFTLDMTAEPSMMATGLGDKASTLTFNVTVEVVKTKILPEVDEKWATETCGFESLDELKSRIVDTIENQKKEVLPQMKENQCLYGLQERLEGEVPEALCEGEERNLLQNFFQQLQQQSITFDAYLAQQGITPDQFKEDVKKQAADVTAQDMALDAWARHAGYVITDEELSAEFAKSGAEDPAALEAEWRATGQMHMLRRSMMRTRAAMELMDNAIVTDPEAADAKPKKKAAAKKTAAKDEAAADEAESAEKKPAKKASTKKTAAKKEEAAAE
ncbi:MAG: trigger factor [Raoultibacter sp.]